MNQPDDVLSMTPETLRSASRYEFSTARCAKGRIQLFEEPRPKRWYVCGTDHAWGMDDGDFDTACVLDVTAYFECGRFVQVAEVEGHYGERFDRVLYPLLRHYNRALVVSERESGGLFILRALLDEYHYKRIWFNREFVKKGRPKRDELGFKAANNLLCVNKLRKFVVDRAIEIRSMELLNQMAQCVFAGGKSDPTEYVEDRKKSIKLKRRGSPDLVMACAYALFGGLEMPKFMADEEDDGLEITSDARLMDDVEELREAHAAAIAEKRKKKAASARVKARKGVGASIAVRPRGRTG